MFALFTDFGVEGPYLGQMKAVLHRRAPGVPVIDLMVDAPRFDPVASAYLLGAYLDCGAFCAGDVVVAVVDPGVGGDRRALVLEADGLWLVGPDNGLLEIAARRARRVTWWEIRWRPAALSTSFHGRDLFAPVAAELAGGAPVSEGGGAELLVPVDHAPDHGLSSDCAEVLYIDAFGNAVTGLRASQVRSGQPLRCTGQTVPFARTFSERPPGAPLWYANSAGLVELALNQGRADGAPLHAVVGTRVVPT